MIQKILTSDTALSETIVKHNTRRETIMMGRRKFIVNSSVLFGTSMISRLSAATLQLDLPHTVKMPVLFVGHGSPMNAILKNRYHQEWQNLGKRLPTPSAILVVSAHWRSLGRTQVMATAAPETIHDFGGFPEKLFDQQYPAKGYLAASELAYELLQGRRHSGLQINSELDHEQGLDHGTWSVLLAMYPEANIPVFQVSIDIEKPADYHYAIGQHLAALRERGVMIMGSGNLVHNLRAPDIPDRKPYDWGLELESRLSEAIADHNDKPLIDASKMQPKLMQLAHPTLEHFYPLLYALGAKSKQDKVEFFNTDFASSAIAMRSVLYSA